MHEVLVNRLGGLSLPRKSVARLTDRPDMTLDVYRGRKTTMQQKFIFLFKTVPIFLRISMTGFPSIVLLKFSRRVAPAAVEKQFLIKKQKVYPMPVNNILIHTTLSLLT